MNEPQFLISGALAQQLVAYLLSRPMGEVEALVQALRQLRAANVVQDTKDAGD